MNHLTTMENNSYKIRVMPPNIQVFGAYIKQRTQYLVELPVQKCPQETVFVMSSSSMCVCYPLKDKFVENISSRSCVFKGIFHNGILYC